jgi:fatty acid desaturase
MRASRIIRYPIDIISVLVVLSTVSLQLFALLRDWPWYAVLPILLMLRQVSLVEHNHAHLTIFPTRFASILLGWLCHLSSGVPLDTYRVHHVMSHHRYNNRFDSSGETGPVSLVSAARVCRIGLLGKPTTSHRSLLLLTPKRCCGFFARRLRN